MVKLLSRPLRDFSEGRRSLNTYMFGRQKGLGQAGVAQRPAYSAMGIWPIWFALTETTVKRAAKHYDCSLTWWVEEDNVFGMWGSENKIYSTFSSRAPFPLLSLSNNQQHDNKWFLCNTIFLLFNFFGKIPLLLFSWYSLFSFWKQVSSENKVV